MNLQLKAAVTLDQAGGNYVFDLDRRDYNLWMLELMPVILVLFEASRRRAYWLDVQAFFHADATRRPVKGAKTVRVHVPSRQAVNRRAVARMRAIKQATLAGLKGRIGHA